MRSVLLSRLALILAVVGVAGLGAKQAGALIITSGCANTDVSCTLAELLDGGEIVISDTAFSNFDNYDTSGVDPADIDVFALDDQALNPGLRYVGNGALASSEVGAEGIEGIVFTYSVDSLDENLFIKDNSLTLTEYDMEGESILGIAEVLGTRIEDLFVDTGLCKVVGHTGFAAEFGNDFLGDGACGSADPEFQTTAGLDFDPATGGDVGTLAVYAGDNDENVAEIISFEQRFSQVRDGENPIPEPGAAMVFAVGIAVVARSVRRKHPRA